MKKILPLMALVSSVACGDTYNTYATGEGSAPLNTCEDVFDKLYACGFNPSYGDYNHWVGECKEKGWLGSEWKTCVEATSCDSLAAGACKQYANW